MAEYFTAIVGVDEAVRLVCDKLSRFAAPNKLPPRQRGENLRRVGNVEIWFDPVNTGIARFHVVTADDCDVDVTVDFAELSSEYLDDIVLSVQQELNKHRSERGHNRMMH